MINLTKDDEGFLKEFHYKIPELKSSLSDQESVYYQFVFASDHAFNMIRSNEFTDLFLDSTENYSPKKVQLNGRYSD